MSEKQSLEPPPPTHTLVVNQPPPPPYTVVTNQPVNNVVTLPAVNVQYVNQPVYVAQANPV